MSHERRTETSLYRPVKGYLETLGYKVKGEVCGCDLVATRGDEPPLVVIGELKLSFSLDLVLQAVDRTAACDEVWLAVGPAGRKRLRDPRVRKLCRFLGFGLLVVSSFGAIEVVVEPRPWKPRKNNQRRARIIDEHRKRIGDPAQGGSTRQPIMTAYRQQALACAASLAEGPRRTSELRAVVPNAPRILLRNWYGWFTRIERGLYKLTPAGTLALARWQPKSFITNPTSDFHGMASMPGALGSRRTHARHKQSEGSEASSEPAKGNAQVAAGFAKAQN
jgi:hypothetical protein